MLLSVCVAASAYASQSAALFAPHRATCPAAGSTITMRAAIEDNYDTTFEGRRRSFSFGPESQIAQPIDMGPPPMPAMSMPPPRRMGRNAQYPEPPAAHNIDGSGRRVPNFSYGPDAQPSSMVRRNSYGDGGRNINMPSVHQQLTGRGDPGGRMMHEPEMMHDPRSNGRYRRDARNDPYGASSGFNYGGPESEHQRGMSRHMNGGMGMGMGMGMGPMGPMGPMGMGPMGGGARYNMPARHGMGPGMGMGMGGGAMGRMHERMMMHEGPMGPMGRHPMAHGPMMQGMQGPMMFDGMGSNGRYRYDGRNDAYGNGFNYGPDSW